MSSQTETFEHFTNPQLQASLYLQSEPPGITTWVVFRGGRCVKPGQVKIRGERLIKLHNTM